MADRKSFKPFHEWLTEQKYLHDDVVKTVFDHIRNVALAALVFGVAVYWYRSDPAWLPLLCILILAVAGLLLFFINFFHGIRKLGDAGFSSTALVVITVAMYLPMLGLFFQLLHKK